VQDRIGILGYGVYIPKYRIKDEEFRKVWGGSGAGVKEKAVPYVDEDSITMAVEAAQNALKHAGIEASQLQAIYTGTVSSPYIENSFSVLVSQVLGLSPKAFFADFGGSTRSGTQALLSLMDAIKSGRIQLGMVIASDARMGKPGDMLEFTFGAGASALILGKDGLIAEIEGSSSYSTNFLSTWRSMAEPYVRRYDDPRLDRTYGYPRHTEEACKELMSRLDIKPEDFSQVALHQPDAILPFLSLRGLGIRKEALENSLVAPFIGDTGSSSPFIGLIGALDEAKHGERILMASYGSGSGSDAFSFRVSEGIDEKRKNATPLKVYLRNKEYIDYPQYEKLIGRLRVERLPMPLSSFAATPSMFREAEYTIGLTALRCRRCGSLNFPKRDYCIDCRGEEFDKVPLPRRGRIINYNLQYVTAVSPEEAPIGVCNVQMEGGKGEYGGKIGAMLTECRAEEIHVGALVELTFRRCGEELGLTKYGYKFRLAEG